MTGRPFLSIVVPVLRGSTGVNDLLTSLARQENAPPFEILLISNPDPDREYVAPIVGELKPRVVHIEKIGVNRARNAGIEAASGEWVYLMDADCRCPSEDHLARLAKALGEVSQDTVVGGPYQLPSSVKSRASRAYDLIQNRWLREGFHSRLGWIHFVGGNLACHRSLFDRQRFDEEMIFGGTELEWLMRVFRDGGRGFWMEDLPLIHQHELTPWDLTRKALAQGRGTGLVFERGLLTLPHRTSFWRKRDFEELAPEIDIYRRSFEIGFTHGARSGSLGPLRVRAILLWKSINHWWSHPSQEAYCWGRHLNSLIAWKERQKSDASIGATKPVRP